MIWPEFSNASLWIQNCMVRTVNYLLVSMCNNRRGILNDWIDIASVVI